MFTVLHSSAGAGKTHALVKHYLTLCLRTEGVDAYRHILALTFTNKAAGEMKERVIGYLERLAEGAIDTPPLRNVMDHLVQITATTDAVVQERARAVLEHMLHHWSEVAISTIDAFTRRVVQPFARDLQLDHDLRMTTEERWYRDRAVEALIAEAGVDPQVTELLSEACLQLLHEERAWDPGAPLRDLSAELGRERSLEHLRALRSFGSGEVLPLVARLRKETAQFRNALGRLGADALALIEGAGLVAEDLAYGKGGIHGWFTKLAAFGESWSVPGVNALKPMESGKWHGGKAGPDAIAALQGIAPRLEQLFHEGERIREVGMRDYFIRRAVLREVLPAFALHELDRCLEDLKQQDAVAFFSDLTRRVSTVVRDEPVPFIYERMGERYKHFLIDEFQDTSLLQWNTLLPLIDNALATDGSALLVGDAKQAIYRWRNGEVRLFTSLPRLFGASGTDVEAEREATLQRNYAEGERLDANHRSASTIVAFNNALFAALAPLLPEELHSVYEHLEQRPFREEEGLVHLERLGKEITSDAAEEAMLDFLMRSVHGSIADGFLPGDIAVLVRSRSTGRKIADRLLKEGYSVVSPDGLRLAGDPVIELLIELLRFHHTGDATAAARAVQYQAMLAAAPAVEYVDPFMGPNGPPGPVALLKAWFRDHDDPRLRTTVAALVEQLARAHGLKPAEDAQVLTLLDEVHGWSMEHGQDIGGFLEHWGRAGGERAATMPANANAVQVMTVHKAKGLQFPVVIVPNARMAPWGSTGDRLWIDPGAAVPELPSALVRESSALRDAEVPELQEERSLRLLDELDLLYVAFTRPEQRLYALVPEARADAVSKAVLAFMEDQGDPDLLKDGNACAPWRRREGVPSTPLVDNAQRGTDPVLILRGEAPEEWDPTDPDPLRRYGVSVHDVLSRVVDPTGLDAAIGNAVKEGSIDPRSAGDIASQLRGLLAAPKLKAFYGPGLHVRTEATIITANGEAARPDRVVMDHGVVRVLDIKTGGPAERHEQQVRTYMRLLADLGHEQVEGALLYVRDGSLVAVEA